MNLSRLGLLLAVWLSSSKEAIAASSDDPFQIDLQDEAISDPASAQTQKTIDPDNDDSVLSSPTMLSSQRSSSSTNNLRQNVQPMHIDRRLDGHSSSFAGPFIDEVLHRHENLRHSTFDRVITPKKFDDTTHRLLRGGLSIQQDGRPNSTHNGRHLTVSLFDYLVVTNNSDDVDSPAEGSLRWAINSPTFNSNPGEYRLIKFDCDNFASNNQIALYGDLFVTNSDVAIDATECNGGISLIDGNNKDNIESPTVAAPILHVQGSRFIYRGMHHVRVPLLVTGYKANISYNHFEKYRQTDFTADTPDDTLDAAINLRSYLSNVSYNDINDNESAIYLSDLTSTANVIFHNNIHDNNVGIEVRNNAGAAISQNRVVGSFSSNEVVNENGPPAPALTTFYNGPAVPDPTCDSATGTVTLTVVRRTGTNSGAGNPYTIELFSSSSSGRELHHYVGSTSGTSTDTDDVHVVTLPCITGNHIHATTTEAGQTSVISFSHATQSTTSWANSCQCSFVLLSTCDLQYDTYCPSDTEAEGNPSATCVSSETDPSHCGGCGYECPNAQDYGAATNPTCLDSTNGSTCGYSDSPSGTGGTGGTGGTDDTSSNEVLVSFDFEVPPDLDPGASCEGAAFYAPYGEGIGHFFDTTGFTFEEKPAASEGDEISIEVVLLDGTVPSDSTIHTDSQGSPIFTGGVGSAIGMFSNDFNFKNDHFLIRFDASSYNYLLIQADIAAGALPQSECLSAPLPYLADQEYQPVLHLILADDPQENEPFDWDNIDPLAEGIVFGAGVYGVNLDNLPYQIDWSRISYNLPAYGSTNGRVALIFNFEGGPSDTGAFYGLLDNLDITGSLSRGFSTVALEEGTEMNLAHFKLNAIVDGTMGVEAREANCLEEISTEHVKVSFDGGTTKAKTASFSPYVAGNEVEAFLHLEDSLFSYFATDSSIESYPICLKFYLLDSSGARMDQKLKQLSIELDVFSMSFSVKLSVDVDIDELTLTKSSQADVSLMDAEGNPVSGANSYGVGDIVSYKVVAASDIQPNSFVSNLLAPAPANPESLVLDGAINVASSLNPNISINGATAEGTIELNADYFKQFSQANVPFEISGSLGILPTGGSRRLESEMMNEEQLFTVPFSVRVPQKERLSAVASGCIAAGIIIVIVVAYDFLSFTQRPKRHVHPDQKSVNTFTTASSSKNPGSHRSSPSTPADDHYQKPVASVKIYPNAPRSHGAHRSSLTTCSAQPDEMRSSAASSNRSHKSHRYHPSSRPDQPNQMVYTEALSRNSHQVHRSHSSSRPVATVKIANCRQEV